MQPSDAAGRDDLTQLLTAASRGNVDALNRLFPLVYDELRRLARSHMRRERGNHTLNATALVHEAYLKLVDQTRVEWQNRAQFYGVASQAMRRILINYAEARKAAKRGGGAVHVELDAARLAIKDEQIDELLALDDALNRLREFNPRGADVVVHRFFGGLTHEEIAHVLGTSVITVRRSWSSAKTWLGHELRGAITNWDLSDMPDDVAT